MKLTRTAALTAALLTAVASWTPASAHGWNLIGNKCVDSQTGKPAAMLHCANGTVTAKTPVAKSPGTSSYQTGGSH
jgi:hypothetical protein